MKSWEDLKEKEVLLPFSYVTILNCFLAKNHAVLVKKDCKRVEEVLRKLCLRVKSAFKGKSGSEYVKLAKQSRRVVIRHGELLRAIDLQCELFDLKAAKESLDIENAELNKHCDELYQNLVEAEELRSKSDEGLTEAMADLTKLKRENGNLWEYFDKITELEGFKNTGKSVEDVTERQQRRKIKELKTNVEQALWFAETFGLKLSSVSFTDSCGVSHDIDYSNDGRKNSYNNLSAEEKEKVQQILFIMDSFCISEAAYHELTMTVGGEKLPRSYLVKQCKNDLNSL